MVVLMRVLFATSEVVPYSKTGGLADVAGALPRALAAQGHELLVVSPWYRSLRAEPAPLWIGDVDAPFAGGFEPVGVGTLEADGVRYAFVGHRDFQREDLYGYSDDVRRFSRFTRAVPQVAARLGFLPDLVHANDWHTGYLPLVLAHGWHLPAGFPGLPSIFTVHNVQYQGTSGLEEALWWLRLPGAFAQEYMNHFGSANAMQAALGYTWAVTTVSPTYAAEIQRPEYGYGLDGTFRHVRDKLVGILNGLDTEAWNPGGDTYLPRPYDADDPGGKTEAKRALTQRLELDGSTPVLGVVSRLADQKGIDLLEAAGDRLVRQGWSVALLGSGDALLERALRDLAARHPGRVGAVIGFDEALAHLIYAGSDALAVPSRFEPCGLSQMIAMRYGTVPIARDTGGLHDTVEHQQTGYLFEHANPEGLLWATGLAMEAYGSDRWAAMMRRAMRRDFSWERSAQRYAELYEGVVASAR
ncbi:MAG: glycogen synthase [Deinococcales bacterium]